MTPREALYHLVMELGPVPQTKRDDNLTPKEATLRDSVNTLKDLIDSNESQTLASDDTDYARLRRDLNDLWTKTVAKQ